MRIIIVEWSTGDITAGCTRRQHHGAALSRRDKELEGQNVKHCSPVIL